MGFDNCSTEITDNILNFVLGGKACFAVAQDKTPTSKGGAIWYELQSKDLNTYFVKEVKGSKKFYLGYFYKSDIGKINSMRIGERKAECDESDSKPLIVVLNSLKNKGRLPGNGIVHIVSDGRCSVCGRRLTDPDSINLGVGPNCRDKLKGLFR